MPLISKAIPHLLNGISQQPSSVRRDTQAEIQENGLSSVARGLEKRPCTEHVEVLSTVTGSPFLHHVKYSTDEHYLLVMDSSGIQAFDEDGNQIPVTDANGNNITAAPSYFNTINDYTTDISAVTVGDTTFLVNKNKTVLMDTAVTPSRPAEAMFYIRQADYGINFSITIDGTTYTHQTPDGSAASQSTQIGTDYIAQQLYNQINLAGYTKKIFGSTIYIRKNSGDFEVTSSDGAGDRYMYSFKGKTPDFKSLPKDTEPNFAIKIAGDNDKDQDDYYVHYTRDDGTSDQYVWKETVAQGIEYRFDETTMPHRIYFTGAEFVFDTVEWDERIAGDDNTNPVPSFVEFTISDIFFHRNRLGFLADENVIFSEAGEYFNFFPKTVLTQLDSNPIDVAVSNNQVSFLRHAVPFAETLLLFSDLTQFTLDAQDLLTPTTVSIDVTTNFEASLRAKPVPAGRFVYFAVQRGEWSGVREYYVDTDTDNKDAADTTAHCPQYLDGEIVQLAASTNEDMLIARTDNDPQSLYVYKYYWRGNEKEQSAWSKWTFSGDIKFCMFAGSYIFIVVDRDGTTCLEKINLSTDSANEDMAYTQGRVGYGGQSVLLDRRYKIETAIADVPYTDSASIYVAKNGVVLTAADVPTYITNDGFVYTGIPYTFKYTFSEQMMKQNDVAMTIARTQLRNWFIVYSQTATFKVQVERNDGRPLKESVFTGRITGSSNNVLGTAVIEDGTYRVPVLGDTKTTSVTIINDTHLPSVFQSAEWEGYYVMRSNRV